jgi:RNA polymerase sigma-70 factor (ECF subfamily)
MPLHDKGVDHTLEQFRAYLECLAQMNIDPRLRGKFGHSDVIQVTLVEAYRSLDRIGKMEAEEQKKWLRKMLAHNLLDEIDRWRTQARNAGREQPLQDAAAESSCRVQGWLASEESSPSEKAQRHERAARVAEALAQLPERWREAVVLQYWHGWTLVQIAEHMQCTSGAVAGLLHRGLEELRSYLPDMD